MKVRQGNGERVRKEDVRVGGCGAWARVFPAEKELWDDLGWLVWEVRKAVQTARSGVKGLGRA